MKKPKIKEIISHLVSLHQRARQLRKETDSLAVVPMDRIVGPIEVVKLSKVSLTITKPLYVEILEEEKKEMLRSRKYYLTILANYFDAYLYPVREYPILWNDQRKNEIEEIENYLKMYEEDTIKLFLKKQK